MPAHGSQYRDGPGVSGKGARVVALGSGTGLATVLSGLRRRVWNAQTGKDEAGRRVPSVPWIADLAAIVGVTDDGGSSGQLRRDFGIPPPGDFRKCIRALDNNDDVLSRTFDHRFSATSTLAGHSLGNLFIAALAEMTGDFSRAVAITSEVLAICGRVFAATPTIATLVARMTDGSEIRGETAIRASGKQIAAVRLDPPHPVACALALEAIADADIVVVGPGSLYTSIITSLLIPEMADALASTHATRVYIANLLSERAESVECTVSDHIRRIYEYAGSPIFDYALVNTAPILTGRRLCDLVEHDTPILVDIDAIQSMGIRAVSGNFAAPGLPVRHAVECITGVILELPHRRRHALDSCFSAVAEPAREPEWVVRRG